MSTGLPPYVGMSTGLPSYVGLVVQVSALQMMKETTKHPEAELLCRLPIAVTLPVFLKRPMMRMMATRTATADAVSGHQVMMDLAMMAVAEVAAAEGEVEEAVAVVGALVLQP